ncbi:phage tail protein [Arthrobacter sp. B2a2-09]
MSDPFVGEIRLVGFNFAPTNWALCNGQLLPISQNAALFSLLGTMYGGNGTTTFGLPDLRGRAALHNGQGPGLSNYYQGQVSGTEATTLITSNLPPHTHPGMFASTTETTDRPSAGMAPALAVPTDRQTPEWRWPQPSKPGAGNQSAFFSQPWRSTTSFRCSGSTHRGTRRSGHLGGKSASIPNP